MGYQVIDPDRLYLGKSYNDWAKDYFSWYFSADPDEHNDGPVVFLKSTPRLRSILSEPIIGASISSVSYAMTEPNVMIGTNRLDIGRNQAILIPAIVAYFSQTTPSDNYHTLKNFVRDAAANSEIPRNININGTRLNIPRRMTDFSLETDVFMLDVPDVEGSYKDYVEIPPLPAGTWPTVGGGYFFLVKFDAPGTYIVLSRVKGKKYLDGRDYFADLLYEIKVN